MFCDNVEHAAGDEGGRTSQPGSRVLTEPVVIWGIGMVKALNRAVTVSPIEEIEV